MDRSPLVQTVGQSCAQGRAFSKAYAACSTRSSRWRGADDLQADRQPRAREAGAHRRGRMPREVERDREAADARLGLLACLPPPPGSGPRGGGGSKGTVGVSSRSKRSKTSAHQRFSSSRRRRQVADRSRASSATPSLTPWRKRAPELVLVLGQERREPAEHLEDARAGPSRDPARAGRPCIELDAHARAARRRAPRRRPTSATSDCTTA